MQPDTTPPPHTPPPPPSATPRYWPLFAASLCAALASTLTFLVVFAIMLVAFFDVAQFEQLAQQGADGEQGAWAVLLSMLGALVGATAVSLAINAFITAALLKLFAGLFGRGRLGYGRALAATVVGLLAGLAGAMLDLLAGGLTLGLFSMLAFSAAAAWFLHARSTSARPEAPLP